MGYQSYDHFCLCLLLTLRVDEVIVYLALCGQTSMMLVMYILFDVLLIVTLYWFFPFDNGVPIISKRGSDCNCVG